MAKGQDQHRKFMLLAIEQMEQTIHEPRLDGKPTPLVGAVLVFPDGSVEEAHRGELREGDHAEFTLLERKNRSIKLDGSVLYTTLEPCAPGARKEPKLGCAERIALARIKEIWVGIEDPYPTVDRKGLKYLEDRGVKINMFDRDLQKIILEKNSAFIAHAKEQAGVIEEKKPFILTNLENPVPTATLEDLSRDALDKYITTSRITDQADSEAFRQRLVQQDLLSKKDGIYAPTGHGILLFAKEPRSFMPQVGLLATVELPDGRTETKDFSGPMVLTPDELEPWLRMRIPNIITRTKMQRGEGSDILMQLLRESIVNALVHRNYEVLGAKIQLLLSQNSIRIKSPGEPVYPITLEQLKSFRAPMLSRNPQLHYVLTRMGLAEERGLGMTTLRSLPESLGLPLPKYSYEAPYLVLDLYSKPEDAIATLAPNVLESFTATEREGWKFLASKISTTSGDYVAALNFDSRTAQRQLTKFVNLGLLRREGKGKATRYELIAR
jgi:ATP-dependent DNA helicase RecG